jgi:mRNA interferase MazF
MWENFKNWIDIKFRIHQTNNRPIYYKTKQIWWCNLGQNIGDEENGKGLNYMRPVLILKKFNKNLCLAVPISSVLKDNKYYILINYHGKSYSALISQVRAIDSKRLQNKIAELNNEYFRRVLVGIREFWQ